MVYRSCRIIDGKQKWVIVDENEKIINKEPKKEELKLLSILVERDGRSNPRRKESYNGTDTCPMIREDGNVCGNKLAPGKAKREYDGNGNPTGRWLCNNCYAKGYRKNPNSIESIRKSLSSRRTCNLNPNSTSEKGNKFEELSVRWQGFENLNITNDNYNSPIDHSRHPILGISQTKGALYNSTNRFWMISLKNEHSAIRRGFKFDTLIFYCASKDGKNIERIYIFPWKEVVKRTCIAICENPSKGGWYEKYRIKDEEIIKKVNDIWKEL